MSVLVRRMRADEVGRARPLLAPEGWTFEAHELLRLQRLGGAVGAYVAGRLIGFLTFVDTPPLRWIGNVAVDEAFRGQGVGQRLVADAVRDAPRCALYSVEKAIPLYARAGFAPQGELFAMRAPAARPVSGEGADLVALADLQEIAALDRRLTGMDRAALLKALFDAYPMHARLVRHGGRVVGFGFAKAYADVTEIGPIVAREPAIAQRILDSLVAHSRSPHDLAIHGGNAAALAAARERGFGPVFRAVPMFRGEPPAWAVSCYHSAAGLEKG